MAGCLHKIVDHMLSLDCLYTFSDGFVYADRLFEQQYTTFCKCYLPIIFVSYFQRSGLDILPEDQDWTDGEGLRSEVAEPQLAALGPS